MLRSDNRVGWLFLAASTIALFTPFAAASSASRPTQTLTVLAFVGALIGTAIVAMILRTRGYVRTGWLSLAALAGAMATSPLLAMIAEFDGIDPGLLTPRLALVGLSAAIGVWLIVAGARRVFPRRVRGLAYGVIALLMVALFPAPTLLLQPIAQQLNIIDVRTQLQAGVVYWTTGTVLLVGPFLALTTLPGGWFERWWDAARDSVADITPRTFAIALVAGTLALALLFQWYSFDRRPTTADEIAQLWHARILLTGRLALSPDPNPEFFAIDNIIDRPVWMSQFPIGGPAVLAVGVALRAAWLLNPVFTALTSWNVYRFCRRAYGDDQARVAAVIVSLSPMMLLMGATYMNHMPTAWLVTLALAALPVWVETPERRTVVRAAALVGGAIGATVAIRPLDGVIAGVVFGLFMLRHAARDRERARSLLVAAAVGVVPIALLMLANWRTTGSATRFAYEVLWGSNHSLGLHDDPTGHPHTAFRALLLAVKYAAQLNWIVTTWPVPVVLIACTGLLFSRRPRSWDVLLLGFLAAQLTAYAFYWHDGQFIGPRFVFTAVPALLILVARAPFLATARLARGTAAWRCAIVIVPVCLAVAWMRKMPPFGVQGLATEFRESRSRLKVDAPREMRSELTPDALIFVQEGAATRLLHRLWGVGVSRPAAAKLLSEADGCSLLEATRAEERQPSTDSVARLARIAAHVVPYRPSPRTFRVPDPNFHVSDSASVTPACAAEIALDFRVNNTVAYGSVVLLNEIDAAGRIGGHAIYVMNLGERNAVLAKRFANRVWYRYEVPRAPRDTTPVLVPYATPP